MKLALIMFGSGVFGGTENSELTMCMIAASQIGADFKIYSPSIKYDDIDPFSKDPFNPTVISSNDNMLTESAKLVMGDVRDLSQLRVEDYHALIIPGGYGVANSLSNLAKFLPNRTHDKSVQIEDGFKGKVLAFHKAKKPIISVCLASLLIAAIINDNCTITLGTKEFKIPGITIKYDTSCKSDNFVYDEKHLLYSTPAFTFDPNLRNIKNTMTGIKKAFDSLASRLKN